jgi:hypothetical protein
LATATHTRGIRAGQRQCEDLIVDDKLEILDLGCAIEETKQGSPWPPVYTDSYFTKGSLPNP